MIWILVFIGMLLFLVLSIPVAVTMGDLGFIIGKLFSPFPLYKAVGEISWAASTNFVLFAIPLFVLLGEILVHTGIAQATYKAINTWVSSLPGGLMHANIATSAMFAATSGSSVATAVTIGTIALPEAKRFGYNEGLFAASIAAGGTLGILIPPSINLIVYGFLTNTSVPKLFLAGFVPGTLLAVLFMLFIFLACVIKPELGSYRNVATWRDRIRSFKDLVPLMLIFIIVIGSIYSGFATPTEAAALGVVGALGEALYYKKVNLRMLYVTVKETMKLTGMIMFILLAATFLNLILVSLGLTDQVASFVKSLGISPFATLLVIIFMYVIMGFFIETLSMMVLTVPVVYPIIVSIGYDPIWFGILVILLIEMALITPPVGLNLYVVQGIRENGSIIDIIVWVVPFVLMIFLMIALLIVFPEIALFLVH